MLSEEKSSIPNIKLIFLLSLSFINKSFIISKWYRVLIWKIIFFLFNFIFFEQFLFV